MNASQQQIQARTQGTQEATVIFLTNNHIIAIIIFVAAIITANLWTEVVINIATKIFNTSFEDFSLANWIILALVFTLIAYFCIVYVFKIPITAAFSF